MPIAAPMRTPRLVLPSVAASRFGALDHFHHGLREAAARAGFLFESAPHEAEGSDGAALLFFAGQAQPRAIERWLAERTGGPALALNWHVDHALQYPAAALEALAGLAGFRLLTVAREDDPLLALRFPGLRRLHLRHAVPASSLVGEGTIEASHASGGSRDIDVLLSGYVHTLAECDALLAQLPAPLHAPARALVALRLAHPSLSFADAFASTMPPAPASMASPSAQWDYLAAVFHATTPALNRARRLGMLAELRGVRVAIAGPRAGWSEAASNGNADAPELLGEMPMAQLPALLARTKVLIAANPTQFTHAWSERLLMGLASGCACVTDDRFAVRRDFVEPGQPARVGLFALAEPQSLRVAVDALLAHADARATLARAGHALVRERHTWDVRLRELLTMLGAA